MKTILLSLFTVLALSLTGCLRSTTAIVVNKNGSAVMTDTVLMPKQALDMMMEMEQMFSDKKAPKKDYKKFVRDQWSAGAMKVEAERMGGGTSLRNAKSVEINGMHGYIAIYDIKNVNEFSYDKSSFGSKMKSNMNDGGTPSPVTFKLDGTTLEVRSQPMKVDDKDKDTTKKTDEELLEQLDQLEKFVGGFLYRVTISTNPPLTSSTGTYTEGNNAVLMNIDISDLLSALRKNPALIRTLDETVDPQTPGAIERAFMQISPSLKFEMKPSFKMMF